MDPLVTAYDPGWSAAFEAERGAVRHVLGALLATDVEHVGSTSVAGLAAKPIIDMIAGVPDLVTATRAHEPLHGLRFEYRPHRPEAQLFVKVDPVSGLDTHHLHLTVPGSALWVERLAFRDAVRNDPALVARYALWKQQHATGDRRGAYDDVKTSFVAEVLAARGIHLDPDDRRLSVVAAPSRRPAGDVPVHRRAVLVTGRSGTGKSTALVELARRGHAVLDTDDPGWIRPAAEGAEPVWDLDRLGAFLDDHRSGHLFVAGCVVDQRAVYDRFDAVVVLTAPVDVLLARVADRSNPFGATPEDRARIAADVAEFEPALRAGATHEIDTTAPAPEVVARLERIAAGVQAAPVIGVDRPTTMER